MNIFLFILPVAMLTQHGSSMEIPRNTAGDFQQGPISPWDFEVSENVDQNLSNSPTLSDDNVDTDFTLNHVDGIIDAPIEIRDAIEKYRENRGLPQNLDKNLVDENIKHLPPFKQHKLTDKQRKLFEQITKENFIERIVGGQEAPENMAPYQVSFRDPRHFCSGSIISIWWILTAAHCVDNATPTGFIAAMGTNSLSQGGVANAIDGIILHEYWHRPTFGNDIALVHVARPIRYNNRITYINMATQAPRPGSTTLLTGWGFTYVSWLTGFMHEIEWNPLSDPWPSNELPDRMRYIQLNTVHWSQCRDAMINEGQMGPSIWEGNVCTYLRKGAGGCVNDSGGPLIQGTVQMGVVSWGNRCARGYPDVYTNVAYYRNWVLSHAT